MNKLPLSFRPGKMGLSGEGQDHLSYIFRFLFHASPRQKWGGSYRRDVSGTLQEVTEETQEEKMWDCVFCGSNCIYGPSVLKKSGQAGQCDGQRKEYILSTELGEFWSL